MDSGRLETLKENLRNARELAAKERELTMKKKKAKLKEKRSKLREKIKQVKEQKKLQMREKRKIADECILPITLPKTTTIILPELRTTEAVIAKRAVTKLKQNKKIPQASEKTLERKRKFASERQRKRRAAMTAEQKEQKKLYDRQYKLKKKAEGTWKFPENMTLRERRRHNKLNRDRLRRFRQKQSARKKANQIDSSSPPPNDEEAHFVSVSGSSTLSRKLSGRRKKNLNKSKAYRDLKEAKERLKNARRTISKYRKRIQRLKKVSTPSPKRRINKLTRGTKLLAPVKQRLLFTETIVSHLEGKKLQLKGKQKKLQEFSQLVSSKILKKYRIINQAKHIVSYKMYRKVNQAIKHKQNSSRLPSNVVTSIEKFLQEDINSKMLPGIRDTKTKN